MSHDIISLFQYILFILRLHGIVMVDYIGDPAFVSPVGYDSDMGFEDHDIATLPLFRALNIGGQLYRIPLEIDF
jgi:hypothetical protein